MGATRSNITRKPKKYVEAGPEWPHEELRFTTQAFGATSQKNMLGPKPKKYEWANAEKNKLGQVPTKTSGTLNEKLKKVAAAEGGGNLFELAAEGRHSLSVPHVFLALAPACFFSICPLIFFRLWPQHVFLARGPSKIQYYPV